MVDVPENSSEAPTVLAVIDEFSGEAFLQAFTDGVRRLKYIDKIFDEINDVQEEGAEVVGDLDEVAAFFDALGSGSRTRNRILNSLSERTQSDSRVDSAYYAQLGYTSVLLNSRENFTEREAKTLAQRPEILAGIGQQVKVSPVDAEMTEYAYMRYGSYASELEPGKYYITGRLTDVSLDRDIGGMIFLKEGFFSTRGERHGTQFGDGWVRNLIITGADAKLTPSVKIELDQSPQRA